MNILITGGAGFVGAAMARRLRREYSSGRVVAFDNLRRRGSELNLPLLRGAGVDFVHGDSRVPSDLAETEGPFDLIVDCSAEPSVLAGAGGSPEYVIGTNLLGTVNCLELARRQKAAFLFLSTSRVYSIAPLRELALVETASRFELGPDQNLPGAGESGISETFPTMLPRSIYGATKLASELLVQEYASTFGLRAIVNRCGVIAGPGQFGKVDQGVFTLWVARHFFGKPLTYRGFGGRGKQVRDLLHPDDLFDLVLKQLGEIDRWSAETFNVGGGVAGSVSLLELTELCRRVTGREVPIGSEAATHSVDIPYYVSDGARAERRFGWKPSRTVPVIVGEIHEWLGHERKNLEPLFG